MKNTQRFAVACALNGLFTFALASGLRAQDVTDQASQSGKNAPSVEIFRQVAGLHLGLPAGEVTLGRVEGPVLLQDLGVEVFVASATDEHGNKTLVALTPDGAELDFERARNVDRALGFARRGKMAPRLFEELQSRPANERHLVVAWLAAPSIDDLRNDHAFLVEELDRAGLLDRELAEQHELEHATRVSERIAPLTRAAAERLSAQGFEVVGQDDHAPIVFLRATTEELARISADTGIESLDWAGGEYLDRLSTAIQEVRTQQAWSVGGTNGGSVKVSIVEGGRVCASPNLFVFGARVPTGATSWHTTAVASCVASRHGIHSGVARGASILSANAADFTTNTTDVAVQMPGSVAAVSWSINQGAPIMNLSYGAGVPNATVSAFDRYLDYIARGFARTIAIACGNSGGFAGDPGAGYNQIAVGAFNEGPTTAWAGETMAAFSSWMNPSTGLETPQVAAPGSSMTMLDCSGSPTVMASGTSFSSPMVAGEAALLIARQPILGSWPEAVRAIVMASAWHNIEGVARLSSRDGAGGIDANAGMRVAVRGRGTGFELGVLTSSSFDASGFFTAQTGYAYAGQQVRVCLSFDSTVSGATYGVDSLLADLDLYVYNPAGQLIAVSGSGLQPFEVVHFNAASTGTYTVKIYKYRFNGTSEFFGTAFTTSGDI